MPIFDLYSTPSVASDNSCHPSLKLRIVNPCRLCEEKKKIEPPNHLDTAQAVDKWTEVDGKYHSIMRLRRKTPTQQSRCQSHLNCHSFFSLRVATLFNVYKFSLVGGCVGMDSERLELGIIESLLCQHLTVAIHTSHIAHYHHPPSTKPPECRSE